MDKFTIDRRQFLIGTAAMGLAATLALFPLTWLQSFLRRKPAGCQS